MTALSLILPCYNEADRLPATLATYLAHLPDAPGTGMLAATGELAVFTDADGAYRPADLDRVVQALAAGPASGVSPRPRSPSARQREGDRPSRRACSTLRQASST
jgi:hypothetical protein